MAIYANHVGINGNTGIRPGYKGNYMMVDSNFVSVPFNPPEVERSERSLESIDELCSVEEHLRWWKEHSKDIKIPCSEEEYAEIRVSPEYDPEVYYCICDPVYDLYLKGSALNTYLSDKDIKSFGLNFNYKGVYAPTESPLVAYYDPTYDTDGNEYKLHYDGISSGLNIDYGLIQDDRGTILWGVEGNNAFRSKTKMVKIIPTLFDETSFKYVESTDNMFDNCHKFTTPFGGTNMPNVVDMNRMFHQCYEYLGPAVCGPKVVNAVEAFYGCTKLTGDPVVGPNVVRANFMYASTALTGIGYGGPKLQEADDMYYAATIVNVDNNVENTNNILNAGGMYGTCPTLSYTELSLPHATKASYLYMYSPSIWGRVGVNCNLSGAYSGCGTNFPKHIYTDGYDVRTYGCHTSGMTFLDGDNIYWNPYYNVYVHNTQGMDVVNMLHTNNAWIYPRPEVVSEEIVINYSLSPEMEAGMAADTSIYRGDFDETAGDVVSRDYLNMASNGVTIYDEYIWDKSVYRARQDMSNCFNQCTLLPHLKPNMFRLPKEIRDVSTFYDYIVNADDMCNNCRSLKQDMSTFKWDYLKYANRMYQDCINLEHALIDKPELEYVQGMYNNCSNLTGTLTPYMSAHDTSYLYCNCSLVKGLTYCPEIINTSHMFYNCQNVTGEFIVSDTLNDASYMYYHCEKLQDIPKFPLDLYNGAGMYEGCVRARLPRADVEGTNIDNMYHMFANIPYLGLEELILNNCENITNCEGMFYDREYEWLDIWVKEDSVTNTTFWNGGVCGLTGEEFDWDLDTSQKMYHNAEKRINVHYNIPLKVDKVRLSTSAVSGTDLPISSWGLSSHLDIEKTKIGGV